MNARTSELPLPVQQLRCWVLRISTFAFVGAAGNLAMAMLTRQDRVFLVVTSLFAVTLAVMARRALARFETDPRVAIDSIERLLTTLFASVLFCSPYPLYSDPALRSALGVAMLVLSLLVAGGVFWFVRDKLSEIRALTMQSLPA